MPQTLTRCLKRTLSCRRGVFAAEYSVLAVAIVIVVGASVMGFQGALTGATTNIGTTITTTQGSLVSR